MFGIGMPHLLLLAAIALIAIGPKQLPEVARVIGRFLNDLKKVRDEFTRTIVESRDNVNQNLYDQAQHQQDYGTHAEAPAHGPSPMDDHQLPLHSERHGEPNVEPHVAPYIHAHLSDAANSEPAVDEKDQLTFDLTKKDS